ncbi:maltose alpha-D-glucosyltransferase [Segetibacter sp. 3557_3]|uniref:maltose alpha-D-glucosyltransferase n=1 Tax=Segetibacter sp. 3557_3 TaxID=2547429 RepID=UPI0010585620|nr:maltose alpha-D-glucosyltransferase [Segetibacter sp. 3557_3]TDH24162.1 maltose alpha-D-glucosyltransferase [Segetibacter sp. 3557_3]
MEMKTKLDDNLHWYKDAIIYELHIKAFCDGNSDGIGDFEGLMTKLDYLQDLGVTAIWVLPFYPSPLKDDGYDISDYLSINPRYGTISQFKTFMNEAHKRNLKVITELVINHTSDQHPWFQRARLAPKGSPERDFYVWTDNPNQWKDVRIIFTDYEASNWTWDPVAQQYYWHRFFHHQPDLNYDNLLVQEEVIKVLDYWCEMGVDGFRLDAVPYLYEREGTNGENLPETHAFLKKLRSHIDEKFPGTVFLAEANMWPEDSASYFGDGDECHMNYHFPVMPRMFMALQMEDRYPITDIFDQTPEIPENCQWAMFLRNHDELTLEMVTDEERDYMYKVYAKDPKAKINLGIRHRLAPLMGNNRRRIELMNCLLFSMPGTPVIYYGDEIGMGDNFYLGDRDGVRTPMQWSPDRNAGFSASNPQKLYLPVILDPEYNYESVNVEMQRSNTSSLFWFMKRMISMRKRFKAFGRGDMKFIPVDNPKVLAFTRTYDNETILVIVNLSKYSQAAEVNLAAFKGYIPTEVFSKNKFPIIKEDSPYLFTLGAHAYEWFELHISQTQLAQEVVLPAVTTNAWGATADTRLLERLQDKVLSDYLLRTDWFVAKEKSINSIAVTNHAVIPYDNQYCLLLLIEVQYESGLPESYQLPLTFIKESLVENLRANCPQSIIARITVGEEQGVLADALFTPGFQQALLQRMAESNNIRISNSEIEFKGNPELNKGLQLPGEVKSKVIPGSGITSISYDNGYVLKMYRKIDPTTNPDLEISQYLSEQVKFEAVPEYAGAITWRFQRDTIALGMLQVLVENHGDGYSFMLTRIDNYIERILSADKQTLESLPSLGTLTDPLPYDQLPVELQELLGANASEQVKLIGTRTAQMHLALASGTSLKEFAAEDFSLHYQRSLFSSMQSLVRETYENRHVDNTPENAREDLQEILGRRQDVLETLKRIYAKKLDVVKIRIHGNLNLSQVIFTGKNIVINDFGGDPKRSFSERRLKRSPLRDVAGMVYSLRKVAYEAFLKTTHVQDEGLTALLPMARLWAHYMVGFFMHAYLEEVQGKAFIPADKAELKMMLDTYMLEKALWNLNDEMKSDAEHIIVPLRIIKSIIGEKRG